MSRPSFHFQRRPALPKPSRRYGTPRRLHPLGQPPTPRTDDVGPPRPRRAPHGLGARQRGPETAASRPATTRCVQTCPCGASRSPHGSASQQRSIRHSSRRPRTPQPGRSHQRRRERWTVPSSSSTRCPIPEFAPAPNDSRPCSLVFRGHLSTIKQTESQPTAD